MKIHGTLSLGLFLMLVSLVLVSHAEAQMRSLLINCGTNSSVDVDGRRWVGDAAQGSNVTLSSPGMDAATAMYNGDPVYEPLYRTARVFTDTLNYTFNVPNGNYFLRLHFYPLILERYNTNGSYFSVEANGFKLVSEFNVPAEIFKKSLHFKSASNSSSFSLMKEYYLFVETNLINVNLVPSKGCFGFLNAIEIVAEESKLFIDSVTRVGFNGEKAFLNLHKRGIETMYRLNVGGSSLKTSEDSFLWRKWEADSSYMINSDAGSVITNGSNIKYANLNDTVLAPLAVYGTARTLTNAGVLDKRFNMSWKMNVDPDFEYLVRLHFCELVYEKPNQRIFSIFIDNKTAADNFDIFVRGGGMNRAYHEDYLDPISIKGSNLWIQLGPDPTTVSAGTDALLNGLEVFKLSHSGNLASIQIYDSVKMRRSSTGFVLWIGLGVGTACIAIFAVICFLVIWFFEKQREQKARKKNPNTNPSGLRPLFLNGSIFSSTNNIKGGSKLNQNNQNGQLWGSVRLGRRFTLTEIRTGTNNFDQSLVIGVGGFGKVYKGEIEEGTLVAIKRANPHSQQGVKEFETEIEIVSKLRHWHLVSLIGFCDEKNEMILVYEYMANGTLRSHLFGSDFPPLSWKQRLEICIGAARGLHYLHTGLERGIIHRDVKTTNILLDGSYVAKVSDFGLSKNSPSMENTHVSTAVKGSFGYLDPEYFRKQQLTEKSDVYSYGVVLFEVVCARAVINPTLPNDEINLVEWALSRQRERSIESIVDPRLRGKYCAESVMVFGEIGAKCLGDEGKCRPTMGEVLWHLEYILQLHETWLRNKMDSELSTLDFADGKESQLAMDDENPDKTTHQWR